jgi:hypothetical protein
VLCLELYPGFEDANGPLLLPFVLDERIAAEVGRPVHSQECRPLHQSPRHPAQQQDPKVLLDRPLQMQRKRNPP